jgi:hypothetical protein
LSALVIHPPPEKLAAGLETLFNNFKDVHNLVEWGKGKEHHFFSQEAQKTAETLLETVWLGFVSDPLGIPHYYVRGKDWDGLMLYRMVHGTSSVEGGSHADLSDPWVPLHLSRTHRSHHWELVSLVQPYSTHLGSLVVS